MWIYNQNRKGLIKVDSVIYIEENKSISTYVHDDILPLGFYSSEKRCLEILDNIKKILRKQLTEYKMDVDPIFEMPLK